MGSIQLWHISILVMILLAAAVIGAVVYFVKKYSPPQPGKDGGTPRRD